MYICTILCEIMKKINIIGEKYGKLTVLLEHSKSRNGHERYTCQCECGNQCNILKTHLRQGNTTHCGCNTPIYLGSTHPQWTGFGEISGEFWNSHIVNSANGNKRKEIELSVTKEYVWNLFLKQKRKCALSGIELKFPIKNKDKSWTASLDRIDSSKGYIEGNVQWVHKDVNMMKNKFNNKYFIEMCNKISQNHV